GRARSGGSPGMPNFGGGAPAPRRRGAAAWGGNVYAPRGDPAPGRVATLADPEGAVFSVVRSAAR
ncbi:VOC family protein, partial [Streptomyces niveus]